MKEGEYLVKVKRYGGGESVLSSHAYLDSAAAEANRLNLDMQTDTHYVEMFDPAKLEGWRHIHPTVTQSLSNRGA